MEVIASLSSVRIEPAWAKASIAPAPDAAAAQRFATLMQPPAPDVASAALPTTAVQGAAINPQNRGEALLNSVQKVSQNFRDNVTRVHAELHSDNAMTYWQNMALMVDMHLVGMQTKMVTAGTRVITQKLNELTHLQ